MFVNVMSNVLLILVVGVTFGRDVQRSPKGVSFVCIDGTEIPLATVCNGVADCQDASDETRKLCRHLVCPVSMFRCAYGACIPRIGRCDGNENCADGSDEVRCGFADVCADREFRCLATDECIPLRDLCNGYADCGDGSDENATTCQVYPCPRHTYHCSYGGCVHPEVVCDGARDCVDGSDEEPSTCGAMLCQGAECDSFECSDDEFPCRSGRRCIPKGRVCDGGPQCGDGSDEEPKLCLDRECPEGSFRCDYGGCIPESKKCNSEQNCNDWSDEDENLCGSRRLPEGACRLPPAKPGTRYRVVRCQHCRPGEVVPESTRLDYSCDVEGSLEGSSIVLCEDNEWVPSLPVCPTDVDEVTCPALTAPGAVKRCEARWGPRAGWISCNSTVPVGTLAILECPMFYEPVAGATRTTCLHDGTWSRAPLSCLPTCGKRELSAMPLIVHGWDASPGDSLPWYAALYVLKEGKFAFFCGGTLLGERLILTAGHCVWKTDPSIVKIVLGSYSSDFEKRGEDAQVFGIENIELHYSYQDHEGNYGSDLAIVLLDAPANIGPTVKPVCVDWRNENDVARRNGEIGLVTGMGITENDNFSTRLRVASAPIVSDEECRGKQKTDFRKYLTYTSFCAGWGNGTGACNGDSGGGLVLRKENSSVWEIHGVVSISPRRLGTSFCDPNYYTIFTKVSAYVEWIKKIFDAVPIFGPPNFTDLPDGDLIG